MVEITKEKLEKLYKQQKSALGSFGVIAAACWLVCYFYFRILRKFVPESVTGILTIIFIIVGIIPLIAIVPIKKKLIPAGHGKVVQEAFAVMQQDYMSERTVNVLFQKIGQASNYADKTMLTMLLANLYQIRGQLQDSIGMLNSVDRSQFVGYPTIGMSFYSSIVDVYDQLEDSESVLAAFRDAEPFINECAFRNYTCCNTAISIMVIVEKHRGNYRKALDLLLMQNDFMNQFNRTTGADQQGAPLSRLIKGETFLKTAELFYLCGDYANAGKYLDIGGPMLAGSPSETARANKLSEKIRAALNNSSID